MLPTEDFTDMTLACEDIDEDDESDDPESGSLMTQVYWCWDKYKNICGLI